MTAEHEDLPRIVGDSGAAGELAPGRGGSAWRLEPADRGLDANVIVLPPGDAIAEHEGPDLDVLIHVLAGSGALGTEGGEIPLAPGALVWLPPRSRRRVEAGAEGLRYFSVHRRKQGLSIGRA